MYARLSVAVYRKSWRTTAYRNANITFHTEKNGKLLFVCAIIFIYIYIIIISPIWPVGEGEYRVNLLEGLHRNMLEL